MGHIRVNKNIRLESLNLSMAAIIFETIDRDRQYLKQWLPFVNFTHEMSDTEKFIQNVVNQPQPAQNEVYSIWYNEEFAGLIGFKDTDWINHKTELGYWIAEKMQGRGIISSCVKELVRFSFKKLKLNRVQIKVAVGNEKSGAVAKRLGFRFEGIEREGELHKNKYLDLQIYSMLKADWLAQY